jgi:hypothetical protein
MLVFEKKYKAFLIRGGINRLAASAPQGYRFLKGFSI